MTIKIAVSIFNSNFAMLGKEINSADEAGVDWIHLDIMDGHFVPNISFGPHIVSIVRTLTDLPLDAHLMISDPDKFIPDFAKAGANYISVHIEGNPHIHRTLQSIIDLGCKPGIVINPGTPIEAVYPILHLVDYVLVMTVNPGFGGQSYIPETTERIAFLSRKIKEMGLNIPIEVDGGINDITAGLAIHAGAEILVAGSYIFNNQKGIPFAIRKLRGE
jgi:ribulose-phosphate 3-epimerase